jgi:hypothetical protein
VGCAFVHDHRTNSRTTCCRPDTSDSPSYRHIRWGGTVTTSGRQPAGENDSCQAGMEEVIEVRQNHELHRLWGEHYNATNVSCVRSENARRHGEAVSRWSCQTLTHPCRASHDDNDPSPMTAKSSAPGSTTSPNAAVALEAPLEVGHPWRHIASGFHKCKWRRGCQAEEGSAPLEIVSSRWLWIVRGVAFPGSSVLNDGSSVTSVTCVWSRPRARHPSKNIRAQKKKKKKHR